MQRKNTEDNMGRKKLTIFWIIWIMSLIPNISARVNLALHKAARQSSTVIPEWSSDKAVDDDLRTCSETSPGQPVAWLTVDLSQTATIDQIGIFFKSKYENRSDLSGYSVYISNTEDFWNGNMCYRHSGQEPPDSVEAFACLGQGRFVTITKDRNSTDSNLLKNDISISICELEITGCYFKEFGLDCAEDCHCKNSGCDIYIGECDVPGCEDGWLGESCDVPCIHPTFGRNCSDSCHCHSGGCDLATGHCHIPGCIHGWDGISCNIKVEMNKTVLKAFVMPTIVTLAVVLSVSAVINIVICFCLKRRKKADKSYKMEKPAA